MRNTSAGVDVGFHQKRSAKVSQIADIPAIAALYTLSNAIQGRAGIGLCDWSSLQVECLGCSGEMSQTRKHQVGDGAVVIERDAGSSTWGTGSVEQKSSRAGYAVSEEDKGRAYRWETKSFLTYYRLVLFCK